LSVGYINLQKHRWEEAFQEALAKRVAKNSLYSGSAYRSYIDTQVNSVREMLQSTEHWVSDKELLSFLEDSLLVIQGHPTCKELLRGKCLEELLRDRDKEVSLILGARESYFCFLWKKYVSSPSLANMISFAALVLAAIALVRGFQ